MSRCVIMLRVEGPRLTHPLAMHEQYAMGYPHSSVFRMTKHHDMGGAFLH